MVQEKKGTAQNKQRVITKEGANSLAKPQKG